MTIGQHWKITIMAITIGVLTPSIATSFAQEGGIIDNSASPHSKLHSINLNEVKWTDGFWADKFTLVKDVTIPKMWEYFNGKDETKMGHHWTNFLIVAGLKEGKWDGRSWDDGDLYKWVEAVAHVYAVTQDPKLDQQMDEIIKIIGQVQQDDGYISTQIIAEKRERFQSINHHELYNMGHLMTAASIHHRITGKDNFLAIAKKTGDYLYDTFKADKPELLPFGFNPSNIMGAVELYRTTGDAKYLELANIFIDNRGKTEVGKTLTAKQAEQHRNLAGTDHTQDRVPLRKESFAVGHAVTATYLYSGAADAYLESGDKKLLSALQRIWRDVTQRKVYVHGAVGTFTNGMSIRRDPVHEAFGDEYFLPNRKSYNETCANIGLAMWNWRMLNLSADAKYADVVERVFYNAGISGLGLDGDSFLYTNVLRRFGSKVPLLRSDRLKRWKGRIGYCCPPQLARTIAKMHGYAYSKSEGALWLHLYGSNVLDTKLTDGSAIRLRQDTQYPWQGDIQLTVEAVEKNKSFSLQLRIPQWAADATLSINGNDKNIDLTPGTYASLKRQWNKGDVVNLKLPMPVRLVQANPLVEETRGQVAVMRGPIVYCLESTDLPKGVDVMNVRLPRDIKWKSEFKPQLLGGVTVLEGDALYDEADTWPDSPFDSKKLYREITATQSKVQKVKLIPYYAWLNRGESQMSVWLPLN